MISSGQQKTFQSLRVILILTKTHTHIYTHTHTYMCVFSLFGLYLNLNGHQSICQSVQIWIRLKKLVFLGISQNHFTHKSVATFTICRNLSERKIDFILPYLVRNFQINARNKLTSKCLLTFSHYARPQLEYWCLFHIIRKIF